MKFNVGSPVRSMLKLWIAWNHNIWTSLSSMILFMCVLFLNIVDVSVLVLCKSSSIKDVHGTIDDIGFSFLLGFIKLIGQLFLEGEYVIENLIDHGGGCLLWLQSLWVQKKVNFLINVHIFVENMMLENMCFLIVFFSFGLTNIDFGCGDKEICRTLLAKDFKLWMLSLIAWCAL